EEDHRRLRSMLGGGIPPAVVEHFVRSLSRPGRLTAGLNYYRANLSRDHAWTSLRRDARVKGPVTLLWGDQDPALGRFQADETALPDHVAEALVMLGIEQPHSIPIPQLIERVWAMQQPYLITIVVERRRRRRRKVSAESTPLPDQSR